MSKIEDKKSNVTTAKKTGSLKKYLKYALLSFPFVLLLSAYANTLGMLEASNSESKMLLIILCKDQTLFKEQLKEVPLPSEDSIHSLPNVKNAEGVGASKIEFWDAIKNGVHSKCINLDQW